jgi:hypothetical protein
VRANSEMVVELILIGKEGSATFGMNDEFI